MNDETKNKYYIYQNHLEDFDKAWYGVLYADSIQEAHSIYKNSGRDLSGVSITTVSPERCKLIYGKNLAICATITTSQQQS